MRLTMLLKAIVALALTTSCAVPPDASVRCIGVARVPDVTRNSVTLLPKPSPCHKNALNNVSKIRFKVSGQLDGEATTSIGVPGGPESDYPLVISGTFTQEFENDWYSPETNLRYAPRSVTTGTVTVEYEYY